MSFMEAQVINLLGKLIFDLKVKKIHLAWGAGTIAGDGSRQVQELELEAAETQGLDFGTIVSRTNFYTKFIFVSNY